MKRKLPGQPPLSLGMVLMSFLEMEELGLLQTQDRAPFPEGQSRTEMLVCTAPSNPSVSASRREGRCAGPRDLEELPARLLWCSCREGSG